MIISNEFKCFVQSDIERIENALTANSSKDNLMKLHREIDGRYQSCVLNWYQGLEAVYFFKDKPPRLDYDELAGYDVKYIKDSLSMMKSKLETYIFGMNAVSLPEPPSTTVNVTTSVNLNVTFEQVRSQIEDMTSLTDEQTQDVLSKVDEIENVVKNKGSKKSKWEKIKPILMWLADKSFDVAMTVLPLLLKINE